MKVGVGMSGNLSKEELRSLMQAIKTWGEQLGDKEVGITFNVPDLKREEVKELLGNIYPIVGEFALRWRQVVALVAATDLNQAVVSLQEEG